MKKRLSVVLALMMSLTVLVGCGQSGSDGSEAPAAQTTEAIESCKTIGDVLALDCERVTGVSTSRKVAVLGLRDTVVVETEDAVLVCPRARSQEVGKLVEALKATGENLLL